MWQLETLLRGMVGSEDQTKPQPHAQTLTRHMIPKRYRTPGSRYIFQTMELIYDQWKRVWVISLWMFINLALFNWKFVQYQHMKAFQLTGYCVCYAKGAGEILKFNMALILIPVCRRTLTRLRSTFLSHFIPFDDNINFHKLVSVAIVIGTFIHTFMHLACNYVLISGSPKVLFDETFGPSFHFHQPTYMDLVKSIPGMTGILIIFFMALSFTLATHSFRKSAINLPWPFTSLAGFNAFWYTHHLLFLVYILLIIHGYFLVSILPWQQKTVSFT